MVILDGWQLAMHAVGILTYFFLVNSCKIYVNKVCMVSTSFNPKVIRIQRTALVGNPIFKFIQKLIQNDYGQSTYTYLTTMTHYHQSELDTWQLQIAY